MAITFVGAGAVSSVGDGNVTPTLPTNIAGDLILLFVSQRGYANSTDITASGYTQLVTSTDPSNRIVMFGKISGGSESNPTITVPTDGSGNDTVNAFAASFRGTLGTVVGIVAHSAPQTNGVSAQDIAYPGLTITTPNTLVIIAGAKIDDWTSVAQLAGMTELADGSSSLGTDGGIVADYVIQTTATNVTSGSFTVTGGTTAGSCAIVVSIKPAATNAAGPLIDGPLLKTLVDGALVQ